MRLSDVEIDVETSFGGKEIERRIMLDNIDSH
jgi:hypothetical protein